MSRTASWSKWRFWRATRRCGERTVELERRTTQLSQMASDLTLAEQRAREELAQTLHDGLQQLLTVATMKVESHIMREAQRGTPADELVQAKTSPRGGDRGRTVAERGADSPRSANRRGCRPPCGWLADWSRSKYGLEVKVSADPRANSDRKDVRTLLFGSVRELLFNVVKHAHVDRVTVDLALGPNDTLCITVTDEGLGFDPMEARRTGESQPGRMGTVQHPRTSDAAGRPVRHRECPRARDEVPLDRAPRHRAPPRRRRVSVEPRGQCTADSSRPRRITVCAEDSDRR